MGTVFQPMVAAEGGGNGREGGREGGRDQAERKRGPAGEEPRRRWLRRACVPTPQPRMSAKRGGGRRRKAGRQQQPLLHPVPLLHNS